MNADTPADHIAALVDGLDPVDWVQVRLTAQLTHEQRIKRNLAAVEFARAGLRATLAARFPDASPSEINLRVLMQLTPVRLPPHLMPGMEP